MHESAEPTAPSVTGGDIARSPVEGDLLQAAVGSGEEIRSADATGTDILPMEPSAVATVVAESAVIEEVLANVPAPLRASFKPPVLRDENSAQYWEMLGFFVDAVKPRDIFDWILLKDYLYMEWDVHRDRCYKAAIIKTARKDAILSLIKSALERGKQIDKYLVTDPIHLYRHWEANGSLMTELAQAYDDPEIEVDSATSRLLSDRSKELESLDKATAAAERRRNGFLNEIGKRRELQAKLDERQRKIDKRHELRALLVERLRKASQKFAAEQARR